MLKFANIDRWKDEVSWQSQEGQVFRDQVRFAWAMLRVNPAWVRLAMCVSLPQEAELRRRGLKVEAGWWMRMQERGLYRRVRGTTSPITVRLRQTGGGCPLIADDRSQQGSAYTLRACVPECNLTFCNNGAETLGDWPYDLSRWNNARREVDEVERGLNMACRATKLSGVILHELMHMCDEFSDRASITKHVGRSGEGNDCTVASRVETFWTFLVQEMLTNAGLDLRRDQVPACWSMKQIRDTPRTPWLNDPP